MLITVLAILSLSLVLVVFIHRSHISTDEPVSLNVPVNLSQKPLASIYPKNTPQSFVFPPLGPAPDKTTKEVLDLVENGMKGWLDQQLSDPNSRAFRTDLLPLFETMNVRGEYLNSRLSHAAIWLPNSQPFKGMFAFTPVYPIQRGEPQEFVLKALLNGQEIRLAADNGELSTGITLHLNRGERKLINFQTEPLPEGVHNLGFVLFSYVSYVGTDPEQQDILGTQDTYTQFYKVYVGTTNSSQKIEFIDWSVGVSSKLGLHNYFDLNDVSTVEAGSLIWKPGIFQTNQEVGYVITLNNPDPGDREYCLIAFLDYKPVPIQNNKLQSCGIVKAGQAGLIRATLTAPVTPGNHFLQVIRVENPLMKDSYILAKERQNEALSTYKSSGRILIRVQ